ncbi:CoA-binding protein [Tenuibacillus multivorans]|uniref:Predicted CoA-binding protein n=1 Tax=Tenuibacillus multivorans TaxID=237069 RepID=A0A1H0CIU9_9BACI|nr:CoA-binding protein [Tenuibacillus multivorans]GEL76277.1 CoA-binding protein [Tenuibacillus multivorans]SDN57838.1 Predicted CoA-binding protein [Tenuibacillus multivorans]
MQNPNNEELKDLLENTKTIAVVGLSDNPSRTSYQISKIMQDQGYKIIPVNPNVNEVLGEKAYDSLKNVEESIDIVNVFRRSEFLMDVAQDAIETDCKVFWAQLGVSDEKAYELLKEHDFTVIMDLCIKVVHSVTIGNRNG